jgi:hypothetical protein
MMTKRWISNMKKTISNSKNMLWGMIWFGWVVVPVLYVTLQKKRTRDYDDKSL